MFGVRVLPSSDLAGSAPRITEPLEPDGGSDDDPRGAGNLEEPGADIRETRALERLLRRPTEDVCCEHLVAPSADADAV